MKTIVQEYGPIYGEPVNGTVMGRPNGSVFVPSSNTIELYIPDLWRYMTYFQYGGDDFLVLSTNSGTPKYDHRYWSNAISQDLASNIVVTGYSDASLTTVIGTAIFTAGLFNVAESVLRDVDTSLSAGDTIYLRAQLENNNTPVATSNVVEVEIA